MRRSISVLLTIFALTVAVLAPVGAAGATDQLQVPSSAVDAIKEAKTQTYIVQMVGDPVVAYSGDIKGLAATKPKPGKKIDPNSAKVAKYVDHLRAQQNRLASKVGVAAIYNYVYSYNGFAALLSGQQANQLLNDPSVLAVSADELMHLDTISTPDFLQLEGPDGIWEQLGGSSGAGEGIIVGIVDSGIWPENPSFSDRTGENNNGKSGKLSFQQIPGWHGKCTPGEDFPASDCNQKVIGAQWFNAGFGGDAGTKAAFPYEFISARDYDGHGSHTASTAAGNYGVPVEIDGVDLGTASGMAPRARIAAYKVCWGSGDEGGCFSSDSVAAIDQAVADGVDVINFSISGSSDSFLDPVEVAFLFAADAGVFVAASAGNSGPGASTVAHNSPWLTTVAAGTHDRDFLGTIKLDNDETYDGKMVATGPVYGPLVYAGDIAAAGASAAEAQLCYPGALDSAAAEGKIVVCDRGVIARTDKSLAVMEAGGIGAVLANTALSSVNADFHYVPTIHVDDIDGDAIRTYAQTSGAMATISGGILVEAEAPFVASFSSRGPSLASEDLLKPDIMAPGVDIVAAVAPPGNNGRNFDAYSGTSMSGPHIAGIAALMKDRWPGWSPMMIKSALMTTASQETSEGDSIPGGPFAYGAGHVAPNAATNPGLVYDAGWLDWLGFLCGTGQLTASYCPSIGIDPSDLNYPSISVGALVGAQTVTRTVTNVGSAGTYVVTVDAPVGIDVKVSPSSLTLASGEAASYEVTFTADGANADEWAYGALTWSDGSHSVRSPLVVKPVTIGVPDEVSGAGTEGSLTFDIGFGYTGEYTAGTHGLNPAQMQDGNVVDDPANDISTALATGVGVTFEYVDVPAGTALARFSLFDEYTDGDDDLDLYVFSPTGTFVGGSGSGTSEEQVDVLFPAAGTYTVVVHGWQTDGPDANYTLFSWDIGLVDDAGNMTVVAPASASIGTDAIDIEWTGLETDTKYLGAVSHSDGGGLIGLTLVSVATD